MKIKFKKYWRKTSFKNSEDGLFFLNHIKKIKPKNFLEIGVFHGVTSKNVCELLYSLHGNDFKFTGIDLFSTNTEESKDVEDVVKKKIDDEPLEATWFKGCKKKYYPGLLIRQVK